MEIRLEWNLNENINFEEKNVFVNAVCSLTAIWAGVNVLYDGILKVDGDNTLVN